MERTIPSTASEEVDLYLRTYYSLLRSTAEVQIRTLEEAHAGMKSLLHPAARDPSPDMPAFIYSLLRLPTCMPDVGVVVMGQSTDVLSRMGFGNGKKWKQVSAVARRRRCFFDGQSTLACIIASRSDIDDIIPLLTAYQIEWNKLHRLLGSLSKTYSREIDGTALQELAGALEISFEDLSRLYTLWGESFGANLERIAAKPCNLRVRLLSGSLSEYRRATHSWWENIERACPELRERPVYFVSSNTHSLRNLISGFALQYQDDLIEYIEQPENDSLYGEWQDILARDVPSSAENFFYYVLKKYIQAPNNPRGRTFEQEQLAQEQESGIVRVPCEHYFDVEAQVVDLSRLNAGMIDPRVRHGDFSNLAESPTNFLTDSNALILNIDYPLGLSAYNILSVVAENVGEVVGVYVMGKSATLNGVAGDVIIPNVVHDEHSQNTYLFPNCFTASDVAPYLVYGTVLDNQKTVSVQGTFLQNPKYMHVFYREGYTDIEMEAGPYLSAVYEMYRPKRHPVNEIVNLHGLPFDLGILHYASDTPLSKGKNLGSGSLSYFGMDSTYATSLAILRRILCQEWERLS